ncbi:hypothetical protein [Haloarchaeobius sp. FL176]|uniref:DUF7342 family protein n=1 Tax=Haloarchaeobius sp. FL176 TaxID=2967129 RepID=UPI002148AACF|nr:hypothetical protein [Haloarchaeobius sp. FL176]
MREPNDELKPGPDARSEPPDFEALTPPEELVRGDRTRDDFLDAVLALDTPTRVSEVAELAGHGVDAAREYLEWFEQLGIVVRVTESPATYERNQDYLNWRRVQRLQREYTTEELLEYLTSASERDEEYTELFGVDAPDEVSISVHASETDQSVEAVWRELSEWQTTRRRIELLERALANGSSDSAEGRTAV